MNWLERILSGQPGADFELVERYTQALLRLARRQLPDRLRRRVDPEDVVQSVYRSFFRRLDAGEFQFEESHDIWRLLSVMTYRKMQNAVKHHRRQQRDAYREVSMGSEGADSDAAVGREPSPEDLSVMIDCLESLLADFPDEFRPIVVMRLEGYSIQEIAEHVKLSRRTVQRALAKLRELASRQLEVEG